MEVAQCCDVVLSAVRDRTHSRSRAPARVDFGDGDESRSNVDGSLSRGVGGGGDLTA